MTEGPEDNLESQGSPTEVSGNEATEYDPEIFNERLACKAMPSIEPRLAEIELTDAEGNVRVIKVHSAALQALHMPTLSPEAPAEVREVIDKGLGIGLIACRVMERNEKAGLAKVEVPSIPDTIIITVPLGGIARKK